MTEPTDKDRKIAAQFLIANTEADGQRFTVEGLALLLASERERYAAAADQISLNAEYRAAACDDPTVEAAELQYSDGARAAALAVRMLK